MSDEQGMPIMPLEFNLNDQLAAMAAIMAERTRLGMSLGDMEEKSGISVNSVYAWRNGQRSPHVFNLIALAETFGFEVIMRRKTP